MPGGATIFTLGVPVNHWPSFVVPAVGMFLILVPVRGYLPRSLFPAVGWFVVGASAVAVLRAVNNAASDAVAVVALVALGLLAGAGAGWGLRRRFPPRGELRLGRWLQGVDFLVLVGLYSAVYYVWLHSWDRRTFVMPMLLAPEWFATTHEKVDFLGKLLITFAVSYLMVLSSTGRAEGRREAWSRATGRRCPLASRPASAVPVAAVSMRIPAAPLAQASLLWALFARTEEEPRSAFACSDISGDDCPWEGTPRRPLRVPRRPRALAVSELDGRLVERPDARSDHRPGRGHLDVRPGVRAGRGPVSRGGCTSKWSPHADDLRSSGDPGRAALLQEATEPSSARHPDATRHSRSPSASPNTITSRMTPSPQQPKRSFAPSTSSRTDTPRWHEAGGPCSAGVRVLQACEAQRGEGCG